MLRLRTLLPVIFALAIRPLSAQVIDNFTDNEFTSNPAWTGDVADWDVPAGRLHLNAPAVGATKYLSTPSAAINNASWEINVELTANPSSTNFVEIFLTSNQSNLSTNPTGYLVRCGNTTDEVSLYYCNAGTKTEIIDGLDNRLNLAAPAFKVRVTRDAAGNWELFTDMTGTGTAYVSEGTTLHTLSTTSAHFGVLTTFTSTRNTWCFFDNINVTGAADITPPQLTAASAISATVVEATFDEKVGVTTGQTASNYLLNGSTSPLSAQIQGPDSARVWLTFASPLVTCTAYTLAATNVDDRSGNVMLPGSQAFTYLPVTTPYFNAVVISEIMADNTPAPICIPARDYVELHNRSSVAFDLQGWRISDGGTPATIISTSYPLCPGEYVVLTSDTTGFPAGKKIPVTGFPALNVGGDPLGLRSGGGILLDSVTYDLSWYRDPVKDDGGWSLELINPTDTCSGAANWIASNGVCGGTPSVQNSVYSTVADTTTPRLLSATITGASTLDVCFTEDVAATYLGNPANYTCTGGLGSPVSVTVTGPACATLTFGGTISTGVLYTLSASNMQDCHGNVATSTLDFVQTGPGYLKAIVINEILFEPFAGATNMPAVEFVELYNRSNAIYNLAGWTFSDATGTITLGSKIVMPGDYVILCKNSDTALFSGLNYLGSSTMPSLNNTGDAASIHDFNGTLIDTTVFNDATYQDPSKQNGGWTIELVAPDDTCALFGNWRASVDPDGGTPGIQNSVYTAAPDLTGPQIVSIAVTGVSTLEVCFNETMAPGSLSTPALYTVNNGIGAPTAASASSILGECVTLTFATPFGQGILYTLSANVQDCKGNSSTTNGTFLQTGPGYFKAVIINEMMPDPDSAITNMPPVEYIELHNRSNSIFDLGGWAISDLSTSATLPNKITSPGDHIILCKASDTAWFSGLNYLALGSLPSLNNTGDALALHDFNGTLIDSVAYTLATYQDLVKQNGGWSLELINPTDTCGQLGNWIASNDPDGGTPGAQNSVYNNSPDLSGPNLLSAVVTGPNTVQLCFDESLSSTSLSQASGYSVNNGIGTATAASSLGGFGDCLVLTFGSNFTAGTAYTLSATVTDCKGNPSTISAPFILSGPAPFRAVLINEVLFDPDSAATGMPPVEFVEVYNRSTSTFDLAGWTFSDPSTTALLSNHLLAPGGYAILCRTADTAWFSGLPIAHAASMPSLNNTGDMVGLRDQLGNLVDTLEFDLSYYGDPNKDDGGWTIELVNPSDSCALTGNWLASNDPSGGTPGLANSVLNLSPDTTGPTLVSVTVVGANTLEVCFDETMDPAMLLATSSYVVDNGIGAPATVTALGATGSCATLSFSGAFVTGTLYTLSAPNMADCKGNPGGGSGVFLISGPAQAEDVIFNEIFPDPDSALTNMPPVEYLELHNRSTNIYNLAGWTISDPSTSVTLGNHVIQPGGYVLLCKSSDVAYFSGMPVLGLSALPSLNNTGDQLGLRDQSSNLIDTVNYDITWYQDVIKDDGGWSLELINPEDICSQVGNWIASNDPDGGTPGFVNSVYSVSPDTSGPSIAGISILSPFSIEVCFNESMDQASLAFAPNYSVDNGLGGPVAANPLPGGTCVELFFTAAIDTGTIYTLTMNGLADCVGNPAGILQDSFVQGGSAVPYQIIINEIFADESPVIGTLPEAEYVELYNAGSTVVDLRNWTITDRRDVGTLDDFTLMPGQHLILCASGDVPSFQPFGDVVAVSGMPGLNNSGDSLELRDGNGVLIDWVYYLDDWYQDETKTDGGWSLERVDPGFTCLNMGNWRASTDPNGGTPGATNSVMGSFSDVEGPSLQSAFLLSPTVLRLYFDELMQASSLNDPLRYTIDNGVGNPVSVTPLGANPFGVDLSLPSPLDTNRIYCVTVTQVQDCPGNLIGTANQVCFGIPVEPLPGDVVLNEILFNPYTGGADFVELYNNSDKIIDLTSLNIGEIYEDTDSIFNADPVAEFPRLFLPHTYVALTPDRQFQIDTYLPPFPENIFEMSSFPSYDDSDGKCVIFSDSGLVLDRLDYLDDWQFPNLDDKEGVSLERHAFERPTQDPDNWHSAASVVRYATPGYENSQVLDGGDQTEVWLLPETFSPDQDGVDDVLSINYHFETSGWNARVTLFDHKGRQVIRLQDNTLLGTDQGTFTWDGINAAGVKSDVGVYVVLFEATQPTTGEKRHYRLGVVLAAKL